MKKVFTILIMGVFLPITTSISAFGQDTTDLNQLDSEQIQQLACIANDLNQESSSSLDNVGSILNETLNLYSENLTDEELESVYQQSQSSVDKLNFEVSIQQLCRGI